MSVVLIEKDEDTDMLCISVDSQCVFEGNTWDFNLSTLKKVLQALPEVSVENSSYQYDE